MQSIISLMYVLPNRSHGVVYNWRAGASLPSRPNGAIFLFIYIYPALMYAVMFYVILNKRKLH